MSDSHPRIAFVASTSAEAGEARERLARRYGDAEPERFERSDLHGM